MHKHTPELFRGATQAKYIQRIQVTKYLEHFRTNKGDVKGQTSNKMSIGKTMREASFPGLGCHLAFLATLTRISPSAPETRVRFFGGFFDLTLSSGACAADLRGIVNEIAVLSIKLRFIKRKEDSWKKEQEAALALALVVLADTVAEERPAIPTP